MGRLVGFCRWGGAGGVVCCWVERWNLCPLSWGLPVGGSGSVVAGAGRALVVGFGPGAGTGTLLGF